MNNGTDHLGHVTTLETDLRRDIGLFDAVSIIAGIMIGSGVFYLGSFVLARAQLAPGLALLAWVAAGLLSLLSGLTYAELGAAMPRAGGAYVYLSEAYGPLVGFLSGWTAFLVSASGSIAALAVAFATYFGAFVPLSALAVKLMAVAIVALLTAVNCAGVKFGAKLQTLSMVAKLVPIGALTVMAFWRGSQAVPLSVVPHNGGLAASFGLALVASLWAYEGWANLNTVAEEIRNPARNLPLAMTIAVGGVTLLYVVFNYALMRVLPAATIAAAARPATMAAGILFGRGGVALVGIGALISIFGSTNGCVLAFPRAYYAMARDGAFFAAFGHVHPRLKTPIPALLGSAAVAVVMIFSGTFSQLTTMVVFSSWVFFGLTVGSVFILRRKYPLMPRPYRVWGYPVVPVVAAIGTVALLGNSLWSDPRSSLAGLIIPMLGIPAYYVFRRFERPRVNPIAAPTPQLDSAD